MAFPEAILTTVFLLNGTPVIEHEKLTRHIQPSNLQVCLEMAQDTANAFSGIRAAKILSITCTSIEKEEQKNYKSLNNCLQLPPI